MNEATTPNERIDALSGDLIEATLAVRALLERASVDPSDAPQLHCVQTARMLVRQLSARIDALVDLSTNDTVSPTSRHGSA